MEELTGRVSGLRGKLRVKGLGEGLRVKRKWLRDKGKS